MDMMTGHSRVPHSTATDKRIPGEPGVWVLILGDLMIFGLLFVVFTVYRNDDPALYSQSQAALSRGFGLTNTLLLLTSSLFVALGVQAARRQSLAISARLIAAAFACGTGFGIVKVLEWGEKFRAGITVSTNDFFMFYFILTGIHMLHVLIGLGVLTYLFFNTRPRPGRQANMALLESGGAFWHVVDLLWIVLFALLYLLV